MPALENECSQTEAVSTSAITAPRDSSVIFKSRLIFFGKITVAAVMLTFLCTKITWQTVVSTLAHANLFYIALVLLLLIPNLTVQAGKWWYLLRLANKHVSKKTAWRSLVIGFPLGFVTPGRLGEIGRAFYVQELSQMKTLMLVVMDKVTTAFVTILCGMICLFPFLPEVAAHSKFAVTVAILLMLTLLILSLALPSINSFYGRLIQINQFDRVNLAVTLALSIAFYGTFLLQLILLVLAFADHEITELIKAAGATFLVKTVLPLAFGDLGIREGAAVYFFGGIGVSKAAALNASLLLYLINVGLPSLLGLPILLKTRHGQYR